MSIVLKLLTKPGCSICQRSVFIMKKVQVRYPTAQILKCDITRLPKYQHYSQELPVILVNEIPVCRLKVRERAIVSQIEQLLKNGQS